MEGSSSSLWLLEILQEGNRWGKQPLQCHSPSLRAGKAKLEQVHLLISHLQLKGTNTNQPHPSGADVTVSCFFRSSLSQRLQLNPFPLRLILPPKSCTVANWIARLRRTDLGPNFQLLPFQILA